MTRYQENGTAVEDTITQNCTVDLAFCHLYTVSCGSKVFPAFTNPSRTVLPVHELISTRAGRQGINKSLGSDSWIFGKADSRCKG